jgi:trk system potassium uptake protein TrkA
MKRHEFAVIGLGRFGRNLALTLEENGHQVLGIDVDPDLVQDLADRLTQAVVLDATNENALRAVDIQSFHTVVVAIGTDFENNLLTTVALKSLGVPNVICKAPSARQEQILLKVGADRVIRPEYEAGQRLAHELFAPALIDSFSLGPGYSVAEVRVPHAIANQTLAQSDLRARYGINVLVIKRGDQVEISPTADAILQDGDIIVVLGADGDVSQFCNLA